MSTKWFWIGMAAMMTSAVVMAVAVKAHQQVVAIVMVVPICVGFTLQILSILRVQRQVEKIRLERLNRHKK